MNPLSFFLLIFTERQENSLIYHYGKLSLTVCFICCMYKQAFRDKVWKDKFVHEMKMPLVSFRRVTHRLKISERSLAAQYLLEESPL